MGATSTVHTVLLEAAYLLVSDALFPWNSSLAMEIQHSKIINSFASYGDTTNLTVAV